MTAVRPLDEPLDRPLRLGVLISGGGRTLLNFQRLIEAGELPAEVALVVASRGKCRGVERAREAGLPCEVIRPKDHASVDAFSEAVFGQLRQAEVDLVTMAGFLSMLRIPPDFAHRVLNVHPALIPSFCGHGFFGHHVHEAVVERGVKVSGCTVHFADAEYDHGPIVLQKCVPVHADDSPDDVADRVFAAECEAYPEAVRLFAAARLEIDGRRVRILDG